MSGPDSRECSREIHLREVRCPIGSFIVAHAGALVESMQCNLNLVARCHDPFVRLFCPAVVSGYLLFVGRSALRIRQLDTCNAVCFLGKWRGASQSTTEDEASHVNHVSRRIPSMIIASQRFPCALRRRRLSSPAGSALFRTFSHIFCAHGLPLPLEWVNLTLRQGPRISGH